MAKTVTEIRATLRYLRIPSRKVRAVADTIKGLTANNAEARLSLNPRKPGESLAKLLGSAIANAKNNHQIESERLYIKEIRVDQGPMFKRWMTRARGGVDPIQKKTSHVTLVLGVSEKGKPSKFILMKPEKKKKEPKAEEEKQPKAKADAIKELKETDEAKPSSEGGAFKRIFRRKAI